MPCGAIPTARVWGIGALLLLLSQAACAQAQIEQHEGRFGRLEKDETWSGTIVLTGDLYIPPGRSLVVKADSTINPTAGKSLWDMSVSRNLRGVGRKVTHPGLIDIIVEGTLRLEGEWFSGISVADLEERRPSSWGALVIINNGEVEISHAAIYLADTAVLLFDQSRVNIRNSAFKSNLAAVEAFQRSSVTIEDSTISANPTGVALYDEVQARILDNWLRFNTSAILIADRSRASVSGNVLFKNIVAVSSLDSTRPQIRRNYLVANQTGIRLGERADPEIKGNWSLFEKRRLVDERDQKAETVTR